jgi:hypothetical protein
MNSCSTFLTTSFEATLRRTSLLMVFENVIHHPPHKLVVYLPPMLQQGKSLILVLRQLLFHLGQVLLNFLLYAVRNVPTTKGGGFLRLTTASSYFSSSSSSLTKVARITNLCLRFRGRHSGTLALVLVHHPLPRVVLVLVLLANLANLASLLLLIILILLLILQH